MSLKSYVRAVHSSSMDYVHPAKVDFVLFYAELTIQENE